MCNSIEIGNRYVVIRSFVSNVEDQIDVVKEVLECHKRNADDDSMIRNGNNCTKLSLGISCGDDLSAILPKAVSIIRQLFVEVATKEFFPTQSTNVLNYMSQSTTALSGLALLYPIHTSMKSHYDSPTQPGQKEEWVGIISLGNPALFRCNDSQIILYSGDVLVMDSMAVLHGVDDIFPDTVNDDKMKNHCFGNCTRTTTSNPSFTTLNLPFPSRLGILFWQGRQQGCSKENNSATTMTTKSHKGINEDDMLTGISDLFA